jgi:hypothetical protein
MSSICYLNMQTLLKLLEKIYGLFGADKARWISFYICAQMILDHNNLEELVSNTIYIIKSYSNIWYVEVQI